MTNQQLSIKLFNESIEMRHAGNYIEAINLQKKSIEVNPYDPDIAENYYSLGKTYYLAGDYKKSVDCYKVYNALCIFQAPAIISDYNASLTGDIAATQRFMSSYENLARNTGYAYRNMSSGKGPGDWDIWYRYMLMGKKPDSMPDMAKYKKDNIESDERATQDGMFVISIWFKEFNSNFDKAKQEIINLAIDIVKTKDNISTTDTYNKNHQSTINIKNANNFQQHSTSNESCTVSKNQISNNLSQRKATGKSKDNLEIITNPDVVKSLDNYYSQGNTFYLAEKYQKAIDSYKDYLALYVTNNSNIINEYIDLEHGNKYVRNELLSKFKDLAKHVGYAYHFINGTSRNDISDKWHRCTLRGEHPENIKDMLPYRKYAIESDKYCIELGNSIILKWLGEFILDRHTDDRLYTSQANRKSVNNTTNIGCNTKNTTTYSEHRESINSITDHDILKSLETYYSMGKRFYLEEKYQKAIDCYRVYHGIYTINSSNLTQIYISSKKGNNYAHNQLLSQFEDLSKDVGYAYHFIYSTSGNDISDKWYRCTLRGEHPENIEDMLPYRKYAIESDTYCKQIGYSQIWKWFEDFVKDTYGAKNNILDIESAIKENSSNWYSIHSLGKFNNQESSNYKNVDIKSTNHDNIYDNGTLKQKTISDVPSEKELSLTLFKESLLMRHYGNYIEAINLQKQSIEAYPDDPDITENYYSLGKTYYLAGDYQKSVDCYKVYNGLCVIKNPVIVSDYNAYLTGDIAATQRFMSSYANLARNTGYAYRNMSSGKGPGDWDIWYRYMLMGKKPDSMPDMAKYKRDNIESDERATQDGMFVISIWFKEFNSNFDKVKKEIIDLSIDIVKSKDNISSEYTYKNNIDNEKNNNASNSDISSAPSTNSISLKTIIYYIIAILFFGIVFPPIAIILAFLLARKIYKASK